MPNFKVWVLEGHPLHAPFNTTVTTPVFSLKELRKISPPSLLTAGTTNSSNISEMCSSFSVKFWGLNTVFFFTSLLMLKIWG